MTFRGPIWVPKVSLWGFWGLVCIEKWSWNFDLGTRSAIFGTPKMAKTTPFWPFWGYKKWHFECPNQNSKTTFLYKLAPKTPKKSPKETKSDLEKVILGHFVFFWYFYLIFPWARAIFFNLKSHHLKFIFGLPNFFQVIFMVKDSKKT